MTAWQTELLGDVCETGAGGTPLSSSKEYYEGGRIPWLLSGEVAQGEILQATKFITEKGLANSSAKIFPRNTILIAMYGATAGQVGILRIQAATNQAVCGIYPNPRFIPEFLYYLFQHRKDELVAQATGNAQPNISQIKIRSTPVPILPLSEQRRIVCILDEAFEGIARAKANAEKNLQNARALFESDLESVFAGAWHRHPMVKLSELATDITDGDHQPPPKSQSGVPFITIGNIDKATRSIDFSDTFKVSRAYFDSLKPNKRPRSGDVLYTVTGSFGIPVVVDGFDEFCFQRHIALIRPKAETNTRLLYYLLRSPQVFRYANDGATGTAQKTVALSVLRAVPVPKLPVTEQERIAARLDAVEREVQHLASLSKRKLYILDALKQSLLHQAFTGQL